MTDATTPVHGTDTSRTDGERGRSIDPRPGCGSCGGTGVVPGDEVYAAVSCACTVPPRLCPGCGCDLGWKALAVDRAVCRPCGEKAFGQRAELRAECDRLRAVLREYDTALAFEQTCVRCGRELMAMYTHDMAREAIAELTGARAALAQLLAATDALTPMLADAREWLGGRVDPAALDALERAQTSARTALGGEP